MVTTFVTRIGVLAVALVSSTLVTRSLGPEGRGALQIIQNTANLAQIALGVGLGKSVVYFIAGERRSVFLPVFTGVFWLTCIGVALLLLGVRLLPYEAVAPLRSSLGTGLAIGLAVAGIAESFGASVLRGLKHFAETNRVSLISSVVRAALLAGLAAAQQMTLLSVGVVRGMTSIWVGWRAARRAHAEGLPIRPSFQPELLREAFAFGGLSFVYSVLQNLHYSFDVFLIQQWRSTAEVGVYTAGTGLVQILWYLPISVSTVLMPAVVSDQSGEQGRQTARTSRLVFAVMAGTAAVVALFAPWIVTILFGDPFENSALVMRLLAPGIAANALHQVGGTYMVGRGRLGPLTVVACFGVTLNVALNVFVIPRWGIAGAALVSSVSYSAAGLLSLSMFCRTIGVPLHEALVPNREDARVVWNAFARRFASRRG